ncbi:MAG: hypothetical protein KDI88_18610, partial [Gammaproteobacteria bacterium]|nr:hypothetical protein [Gammaproteobacteria bacterium]
HVESRGGQLFATATTYGGDPSGGATPAAGVTVQVPREAQIGGQVSAGATISYQVHLGLLDAFAHRADLQGLSIPVEIGFALTAFATASGDTYQGLGGTQGRAYASFSGSASLTIKRGPATLFFSSISACAETVGACVGSDPDDPNVDQEKGSFYANVSIGDTLDIRSYASAGGQTHTTISGASSYYSGGTAIADSDPWFHFDPDQTVSAGEESFRLGDILQWKTTPGINNIAKPAPVDPNTLLPILPLLLENE